MSSKIYCIIKHSAKQDSEKIKTLPIHLANFKRQCITTIRCLGPFYLNTGKSVQFPDTGKSVLTYLGVNKPFLSIILK